MGKKTQKPEASRTQSTGPIKRLWAMDKSPSGSTARSKDERKGETSDKIPSKESSPGEFTYSPETSAEQEDLTETTIADLAKILPSKSDLAEMLQKLETSLKTEISYVKEELSQALKRIEETEKRTDMHAASIKEIQEYSKDMQYQIRAMAYKMENQENRSRRNNLRIRGLPEKILEDELKTVIQKIFNNLLERQETDILVLDRIHRALGARINTRETPRDLIVRFHYHTDKALVMEQLRKKQVTDLEGNKLEIYTDLAPETLTRQRALKPLTQVLRDNQIKYRWGFPACLTATRDGRSATLRFPEELHDFCDKLDVTPPDLPNWEDFLPKWKQETPIFWEKRTSKLR